jgi:transposase
MTPKKRTYTAQQRVAAVASYYQAGKVYKKAKALLLLAWLVQWGPPPATPDDLIRRTVQKFEATGSVADKPRSGRPRKFSDAKARAAAKLFKQGYEVCRVYQRGRPPLRERRYYTSIKDALDREPRLEQIRDEAGISAKALLRRMREADDSLIRRRLDIKGPLSLPARLERQRQARLWLAAYENGGRAAWLRRLVFLDEATIYIADAAKAKTNVWCDAYDDNACGVAVLNDLGSDNTMKLRFYIAISAVLGPLMIYFTTGTTDLHRLYTGVAPPLTDEGGQEYFEVRGLHWVWG